MEEEEEEEEEDVDAVVGAERGGRERGLDGQRMDTRVETKADGCEREGGREGAIEKKGYQL